MRKYSLLSFALGTALVLTGCESKPESPPEEKAAIPVTASKPVIKDIPVYIDSIGLLQADVSMDIRPQVTGQLAKVLVREGDWVKKGTPLFEIDAQPYAIKMQEAEAQLAMDRADYLAAQKKRERLKSWCAKIWWLKRNGMT